MPKLSESVAIIPIGVWGAI